MRKVILKAIDGHADQIRIDALGSITAVKSGTEGPKNPRIMLAAHMDEIGFMVQGVDSDGLIRFTNVGGIDARILPGLRVRVGDKALPGVVIWTPIHKNRDQATVKLENLRIDIGASSKEGVNGQVKRGERIAFDSTYVEMSDRVRRGKAFDDRVGCSLLVDILQGGPYPVDVLAAFTVQEEIGLRGAGVAAKILQPDLAIVLEGNPAHDLPDPLADPDDRERPNPAARLGAGPALTVMDRSMIADPRLLKWLRATADFHDIPCQLATALGGGTDAGSIHTANSGIPSAVISVPCRYIHSPSAVMHLDDYEHTLQLITAALNSLTPAVLEW
ncbi:MAG: M42 family peptidase [Anaerolineae bacterium]|nr:M42 family peptidase [Anaerolineae bacterium]